MRWIHQCALRRAARWQHAQAAPTRARRTQAFRLPSTYFEQSTSYASGLLYVFVVRNPVSAVIVDDSDSNIVPSSSGVASGIGVGVGVGFISAPTSLYATIV